MKPPTELLANLAKQPAPTWMAMAEQAFRGEAQVETANSVYLFREGVLVGRATKPSRAFEALRTPRALQLVGFLRYENGLWSLSAQWRIGAVGVLFKRNQVGPASVVLTSATVAFSSAPPRASAPRIRHDARPSPGGPRSLASLEHARPHTPPTLRPPKRASMTRVLAAAPQSTAEH